MASDPQHGRLIEVKPRRPVQMFINGVATVVAAGVITLAAGPALDQGVRWYTGKSYTLTDVLSIPPLKSKAKPQDTPANTYATTYGSVTSSSYTSAEVISLTSYTPVPLVYAVTEPMPSAVTTPAGERIAYIRATTDDLPALIVSDRQDHPDHPKHVHQDLTPGLKPPALKISVHDDVWPDALNRV